ncbi:hypothetical protein MRX96_020017 [Rhipicephalus microplus]
MAVETEVHLEMAAMMTHLGFFGVAAFFPGVWRRRGAGRFLVFRSRGRDVGVSNFSSKRLCVLSCLRALVKITAGALMRAFLEGAAFTLFVDSWSSGASSSTLSSGSKFASAW